jgi:hypothetical protein
VIAVFLLTSVRPSFIMPITKNVDTFIRFVEIANKTFKLIIFYTRLFSITNNQCISANPLQILHFIVVHINGYLLSKTMKFGWNHNEFRVSKSIMKERIW